MNPIDPAVVADAQRALMRAMTRNDFDAAEQAIDVIRVLDPDGRQTTYGFVYGFCDQIVRLLGLTRPGVVFAVVDTRPPDAGPDPLRDASALAATAVITYWAGDDRDAVDRVIETVLDDPTRRAAGRLVGCLTALYREAWIQHQAATS